MIRSRSLRSVVISTGMNYLLSPTTTLIRDIFQRFFGRKESSPEEQAPAGEQAPAQEQEGIR